MTNSMAGPVELQSGLNEGLHKQINLRKYVWKSKIQAYKTSYVIHIQDT